MRLSRGPILSNFVKMFRLNGKSVIRDFFIHNLSTLLVTRAIKDQNVRKDRDFFNMSYC